MKSFISLKLNEMTLFSLNQIYSSARIYMTENENDDVILCMRILLGFQIIYFPITNINQISKLVQADILKNEIICISHPMLMICYMMLQKIVVHISNL